MLMRGRVPEMSVCCSCVSVCVFWGMGRVRFGISDRDIIAE